MHFASFLSGGFIIAIVVNPPERKLAKRTSVQCSAAEKLIVSVGFKQNVRNLTNCDLDEIPSKCNLVQL